MYRVAQRMELLLFRVLSALVGSWNRVFFNFKTEFLGVFSDETGVENMTCAPLACSLAGASSSDSDLPIIKSTYLAGEKSTSKFEVQIELINYLILRTPLRGDFDFFRFGVLLPMSIISISCVKPVLCEHPSSALAIIWCSRLALLLQRRWKIIEINFSLLINFCYSNQSTY